MKSIQGDWPYHQIPCKMYRMQSLAAPLHQPGDLVESWVFLKRLCGEHFFTWGFIKSDMYQVKINSIQQLKQWIRAAAAKITPAMLEKVLRSVVEGWSLCLDVQGGHTEMY